MSHSHPAPAAGSLSGARTGWRSLERRLPLVMFGLLALILAVTLALTYATLAKSAQRAMGQRLMGAAQQLATLTEGSMNGIHTRLRAVARDTSVRRALVDAQQTTRSASDDSASTARVSAALGRSLIGRIDSSATAELWTVDGRRVAHAGADIRAGMRIEPHRADLADRSLPLEGFAG